MTIHETEAFVHRKNDKCRKAGGHPSIDAASSSLQELLASLLAQHVHHIRGPAVRAHSNDRKQLLALGQLFAGRLRTMSLDDFGRIIDLHRYYASCGLGHDGAGRGGGLF